MKCDWLIVGAGFTGATLAERIANVLGEKVLLVERRDHVGGNAHDYYNEHGILVHKYGPHIFHTNSDKVWNYLSIFTDWRPYYHCVRAVVEGKRIPVPFNLNSLAALFPSRYANKLEALLLTHIGFGQKVPILRLRESTNSDLKRLADYVYDNVFLGYTRKQWGLRPEELDASVTGRVPLYVSRDDRYFQDTYQAMPRRGYTELFRRMLDSPNVRLLLNTDYREILEEIQFNRMIYTGPIDLFFDYMYGELPYRSLRFEFTTHEQSSYQEVGTVNYPNDYQFTRTTEQKYLTGQRAERTTVIAEYPEPYIIGKNEPYYPVPQEQNQLRLGKYRQEIAKLNGTVVFAGRLADYKYYNMDQAVGRALHVFETEVTRTSTLSVSSTALVAGVLQ
jgi:UDP-galactopyranose mutase